MFLCSTVTCMYASQLAQVAVYKVVTVASRSPKNYAFCRAFDANRGELDASAFSSVMK